MDQLRLWRSQPRPARGSSFRVAEFFAGIGLVRMGLEASGWTVVYANDIDPEKRDQYLGHFDDSEEHFELADIHSLDATQVPSVELATASFPCTDLSLAGSRAGIHKGAQSSAFWGFIRVLREMKDQRPPIVLLENVVGFISSHDGGDFRAAMLALNELGYAVDPLVLDAKWFVPQSRPRLFVVASQCSEAPTSLPVSESRLRPGAVVRFIQSNPSIRWRIRCLAVPPLASETTLAQVLEPLPDSAAEWWSSDRVDYLYRQFSSRHRALADDMIARRRWSFATVFRRVRPQGDGSKRSMAELRTDGLAGCLRTPKGGSGRQILVKAGYGRLMARLLTPRECARLMGADSFRISGPDNRSYFGFGDAVCVPAVSWLADHYLSPLMRESRMASLAM